MEEWRSRSIGNLFQQEVRPRRIYAKRCTSAARGATRSQATSIETKTRQQPHNQHLMGPIHM